MNIRNIIREEVADTFGNVMSLVNEGKYVATTEGVETNIVTEDLPDGDYISDAKSNIEWKFDFTFDKKLGVDSVSVTVYSLDTNIEIWKEEEGEYSRTNKKFLAENYNVKIEKLPGKGQIAPVEATITPSRGEIEIQFNFI